MRVFETQYESGPPNFRRFDLCDSFSYVSVLRHSRCLLYVVSLRESSCRLLAVLSIRPVDHALVGPDFRGSVGPLNFRQLLLQEGQWSRTCGHEARCP